MNSFQNHNSNTKTKTDEMISNTIVIRNGSELVLTFLLLMDQAVIHSMPEGINSNSSLNLLPRSGMWPPP
ncbi:hypothetical protein A2U01_0079363 [Trifolium medium]|uniref:Uncharacterized protein n=1 Tax=Trifolium medium TaxID=97028 RepID=A0A392TD14_9FABA|nr:hypothetical protein [Trifolium medium]